MPAIKPAAERSASGLISVLATPGTIRRPIVQELIKTHAVSNNVDVTLVGATRLARMAEEHMQGNKIDSGSLLEEINECFVDEDGKRTDIVALGCTHYPFLVNEMRKLAPWPVDWLDPAEAVSRQAAREIERCFGDVNSTSELSQHDPDLAYMTSRCPSAATARLLKSAGLQLAEMEFPSLI